MGNPKPLDGRMALTSMQPDEQITLSGVVENSGNTHRMPQLPKHAGPAQCRNAVSLPRPRRGWRDDSDVHGGLHPVRRRIAERGCLAFGCMPAEGG